MVTIVLFDKNYNFIDVAYAQAGSGSSGAFAQVTASYKVREAGYAFLYISNENPMMADAYFDDVQMSYVPSRILQYNEYYPFGLQTASSWTRDGAAANSYLANGGSEINSATKLYDLDFRNYDPALGRLHQIDLMADKYSSVTPYNFTFNNPGNLTDKSGLDPNDYLFTFMDQDMQNLHHGAFYWRSNDQAWPTAPAPNQGAKQQPGQTNADFLYELADEAGDGIHVYTNDGTGYFRYNEAASNQAMNSYGLASFKWYDKPDANGISAEGVYRLGGQAPTFKASQGNTTFVWTFGYNPNLPTPTKTEDLGFTFVDKKYSSYTKNSKGGYDVHIRTAASFNMVLKYGSDFLARNPNLIYEIFAHEQGHSFLIELEFMKMNIPQLLSNSGLEGEALDRYFKGLLGQGSNSGLSYSEEYVNYKATPLFLPNGQDDMNYIYNRSTIKW